MGKESNLSIQPGFPDISIHEGEREMTELERILCYYLMMEGYFYYCQESTALEAVPEPKGWNKFSDQQFSPEKSNSVLPWVSYNRDNTVSTGNWQRFSSGGSECWNVLALFSKSYQLLNDIQSFLPSSSSIPDG